MKRPLVVAASIVSIVGAAILLRSQGSEHVAIRIGSAAPELRAYTLKSGGGYRSIADYRGQVVLLNVWATWCPPCREEMPSLQALHETLADRGLRVVAVSIDDPGSEDQIHQFLADEALTFEVLHDPDAAIMRAYQVGGVPQTFLIDRAGTIRYKSYVTDWRTVENRRRVEALLSENR